MLFRSVCSFVSLGAQRRFERRERAENTEPGLCHDYCDGGQMREPEPQGVDLPPEEEEVTCNDENEAANDECHDGDVQRENHIGE